MSRVDENMLIVTQLSATIEGCNYDYNKALAISVSGLLADISASLAVIADAIKDQENTDAEAKDREGLQDAE